MKISVYPVIYFGQKILQRFLYLLSKQYRLEIDTFFRLIKDYDYVVIKLDTPNKHKEFPFNYKIGTDIDILVLEKDLCKIKEVILMVNKDKKFSKLLLEDNNNCRIRYQFSGFLNLLFDLTSSNTSQLLQDCLVHYRLDGIVKVPTLKYELVLRYLEFQKKPKKQYHATFINKHKEFIDLELLKKYKLDIQPMKMIIEN